VLETARAVQSHFQRKLITAHLRHTDNAECLNAHAELQDFSVWTSMNMVRLPSLVPAQSSNFTTTENQKMHGHGNINVLTFLVTTSLANVAADNCYEPTFSVAADSGSGLLKRRLQGDIIYLLQT
jgi:hypothetical protein